ncbi:hypothetical protein OG539_09180 [Actinacidiphila glaucinigra]|uniref:hypothetical protein n=1 Tax=Actinacidiphila glaucinigra TaxID=235986 RepID=UPI002DD8F8D2|nr:hypothetical protein [Actinacidiphila glaucinigra]WSD63455.1 hypothetical protein OIE69_33515 [Actinacidiphila glaucinigra]
MRTALLPAALATAALGVSVVSCADAPRSGDAPRPGGTAAGATVQDLRVGAVCSSHFAFATDISCGLVGLGDVRFHCSDEHGDPCPRTRSVTFENIGRTSVRLVAVSGSAPGERHETVSRALPTGARATVAPRAGDGYLYDVLLRADTGSAAVGVVAVS